METESLNIYQHKDLKNSSSLIFFTCCILDVPKAIGALLARAYAYLRFYEGSFSADSVWENPFC